MDENLKDKAIAVLQTLGWSCEATESGLQARMALDKNGDFELMFDLSDGYFHYAVWDWRQKRNENQKECFFAMLDSVEHFADYGIKIRTSLVDIRMALQMATDTYVSVFEREFQIDFS